MSEHQHEPWQRQEYPDGGAYCAVCGERDPDPIVQAVAEALHADQCPDDECDGGDMGEYERMAEVAVTAARPLIEREAEAAALREAAGLYSHMYPSRGAGMPVAVVTVMDLEEHADRIEREGQV